jgi:hypothetical protein
MDLSPLEKPVSRIRKRPEENQRSKTRHVLYILTFIDFRKSRSSKRKSSPDKKRDYSRDRSPVRGNDRRERRSDNDRRDRDKNRDRDYRDEKGSENLELIDFIFYPLRRKQNSFEIFLSWAFT